MSINEKTRYISPIGTVAFMAYPEPYEGDLIIRLRFDEAEADAFRDTILPVMEEDDRKKKAADPVKPEIDEETEEPTGFYLVSFKAMAGGIRKNGPKAGEEWRRQTTLVDAHKAPMGELVGKGSRVRVCFTARATEYQKASFIQLQPVSAQCVELVPVGSDAAAGFDEVDGGFESDVAPSAPTPQSTDTDRAPAAQAGGGFDEAAAGTERDF